MTKTILAAMAALVTLTAPAFAAVSDHPSQTVPQVAMQLAQDEGQDQAYPGNDDESDPFAPSEDSGQSSD